MFAFVVLCLLHLSAGLPAISEKQCRPKSRKALSLDEIDELVPRPPADAAARRRNFGQALDEEEQAFGEGEPLTTKDLELGRSLAHRHLKHARQLEEEAGFFEGDILVPDPTKGIADAVGDDWPSTTIPYAVSSELSPVGRAAVAAGQELISNSTCIRFKAKSPTDVDYLLYGSSKPGCFSYVGRRGGMQTVNIGTGCESPGIAGHESLHALGFFHEQARADRDNYVTIAWPRIRPGNACHNFYKQDHELSSKYDYLSVMHYHARAFARDRSSGLPTIITKDARYQEIIGQRFNLSPIDIQRVCDRYKCGGDCRPEKGFAVPF